MEIGWLLLFMLAVAITLYPYLSNLRRDIEALNDRITEIQKDLYKIKRKLNIEKEF